MRNGEKAKSEIQNGLKETMTKRIMLILMQRKGLGVVLAAKDLDRHRDTE